jgi:hypothetical protein
MNPYIIVDGQSTLSNKIKAINQLRNKKVREEWKKILMKYRYFISRTTKVVILNNPRASITFRFNVSYGKYDISLLYVSPPFSEKKISIPSQSADRITYNLDSVNRKSMILKKIKSSVYLYRNVSLSSGVHTVTVTGEPVGLISLIVRNTRTRFRSVIRAVDMLYRPPPPAPIPYQKPVEQATTTTLGPSYYDLTTTSGPSYYELTTTLGPSYEMTTTSEIPVVPPVPGPFIPPAEETTSSSSAPPTSTTRQPLSKKKQKGLPWWAVVLILLAIVAVLYLIYRWLKRRRAVSYQDQSDQQILLDFTDKSLLLRWINNRLQKTTLQFSERKELQSLKGALQSKSRSPEQQALLKRMLKCRHPETSLLKWLERRSTDPTLSQADKKEYNTLIQALKKRPDTRSQQQKQNISRMLDCKDMNAQAQKKLLRFVENNLAKQGLRQAERKQYNALKQALQKSPQQRDPQQKQLVSFALNCKQQGKPILLPPATTTTQEKTQQKTPSLVDYSFMRTQLKPDQQQTLPSSLTNKLLRINDKYGLKLVDKFYGQDELGDQVFKVVQSDDNTVKQYLQKFDPANKQSQEQFLNVKQRLDQVFPEKKNNILIQKIKQKRQAEAFQGAASLFAGAQKKAAQQEATKRQTEALQGVASLFAGAQKKAAQQEATKRQTEALQGVASLFAGAQKKAAQQEATKRQTEALQGMASLFAGAQKKAAPQEPTATGGQYQRLIKLANVPQDGSMTNIRQNIKKLKSSQPIKTKVRLTPDTASSQQPNAYQRQFGRQTDSNVPAF